MPFNQITSDSLVGSFIEDDKDLVFSFLFSFCFGRLYGVMVSRLD